MLTKDVVAGHKFTVDAHVDTFVPFKFTCAICGANCSITIPIVKKSVSFALPPCPIKAGPLKLTQTVALPSSSPVPIKAKAKGKVTVTDPSGATVADVDVQGDVSPSLVESPPVGVDPFGCHKKTDCSSCVEKAIVVDYPCYWCAPLVDRCRRSRSHLVSRATLCPTTRCEIDNACHDVGSLVSPCSQPSADSKCVSLSPQSNCAGKDVSACPASL